MLQHSSRLVACLSVYPIGVFTVYSICGSNLQSKCCLACQPMCSSGAGGGRGGKGGTARGGGGLGVESTLYPKWPMRGAAGGGGAGWRA